MLAKEIFWRSLPCNKLRYPCPPGPNRFAGFGSGTSPFGGAAQPQQVRLFWHLSLPPHTAFHPDVPPLPTPFRASSAPLASPPPPSAAQAPALATPKPPPSATSSRPLLPPAPRLRLLAEAVASSAPLPSNSSSSSPAFGGPAFGGQSGSFGESSPTGGFGSQSAGGGFGAQSAGSAFGGAAGGVFDPSSRCKEARKRSTAQRMSRTLEPQAPKAMQIRRP